MLKPRKSAFTLVEIMVVASIIGLLAALALPTFMKVKMASQNSRLANDLRVFASLIEVYLLETGKYPEDSNSGVLPAGFADYVKPQQWAIEPSIGGVWDVEYNSYNVVSAIGVHRYTVTDEQIEAFDQRFDDGNVSTGQYRKLDNDRYYRIVAE
ncbi:MAG: type II secretion system protein [Coraliomargarita sp.]